MEPWKTEIAEIERIKQEGARLSAKETEIGELLAAAIHHAHAAKAKVHAAVSAENPPDSPEFMVGLWLDVQGTLAALYGVAAKSSYTTQKPVLNMQKLIDAGPTLSRRSN